MAKNKNSKPRGHHSKGYRNNSDDQALNTSKSGDLNANAKDSFNKANRGQLHADNDISWYNKYPALLRDSASIVFPEIIGRTHNWTGDHFKTVTEPFSDPVYAAFDAAQPGIMALEYSMIPGISKDYHSPVNQTAQALYSYVVHFNSRGTTYDAPDLMMYILAMDAVYAYYAHLCRIYGVINWGLKIDNDYFPRRICSALKVDYDDIVAHKAEFRYFINEFAHRINYQVVPAVFPAMARHIWMNSHIFADEPGSKYQVYIYRPYGFGVLQPYVAETGTVLEETKIALKSADFSDLRKFADTLLDPIMQFHDVGVMKADMLKAFSAGELLTAMDISEDYVCAPVYSAIDLDQIENATVLRAGFDPVVVSQDTPGSGAILCVESENTTANSAVAVAEAPKLLNVEFDDPSPEWVMEASRLTVSTGLNPDGKPEIKAVGTEFIRTATIYGVEKMLKNDEWVDSSVSYTLNGALTLNDPLCFGDQDEDDILSGFEAIQALLERLRLLGQFRKHPRFFADLRCKWLIKEEGFEPVNAETDAYTGYFGDITNVTRVSEDSLYRLHETALLSEWNVPDIGVSFGTQSPRH